MSSFSRDDVKRIAALARLEVNDAELDLYARQLGGILGYAERIQKVDTAGVPPFISMGTDDENGDGMRCDTAVASLSRDEALRNAPQGDTKAGTFVVPKVIG